MASLIPNLDYTPNTAAASNAYISAMKSFNDSLMEPVNFLNKLNTDALAQKEREEEKAIRAEDRAWKLEDRKITQGERAEDRAWRQEERKITQDERARLLNKETATNEALRAVLDPKAYQQEKRSAEQQAIQSSLMNLSPEERAVAEQQLKSNYNANESSAQWLANALGNANVDQSTLLSTKKNVYDIAASTPGTPEFQAKIAADRAEKRWASDLAFGKQKAAALFSDALSQKREDAKELRENAKENAKERKENELASKLSNLLDVSTTKDVSKEVAVPGTPEEAKAKIEENQAAYGVLFNNYFKKNPNATFEEADNTVRRQLGVTVPIDKYFAREDSTKTVAEKELKPKNEYISDLLGVAKEQGIVNSKTLQLIQEQAKTAYEVDKDKVKESKAVESLKKAIEGEDKKVDTTGIFDSDVLKLKYKDILDRKKDYGSNDSKYGIGGEALKALDEVGIDTWGTGTQKEVVELAKQYKITDKDLAAIIRTSDLEWSPTMSSTVVDRIKDALETYQKKYKQ